MADKTVCVVSAEAMIPELGPFACGANQRGGLGDLFGHMLEGFIKKGIHVIPITYFYPRDWQTGEMVDYNNTPARCHYALDSIPNELYNDFALDEKYRFAFLRDGVLDPTLAGVRLADLVTGVSEEHGGEVRKMYPEYAANITGLRNGTSRSSLLSPRIKALQHTNPYSLWTAHLGDRAELHEEVRKETGILMDPERPDIVLFRREADYKNRRPMFEPNIHAICAPRGKPLNDGRKGLGANVIFGGVAHENYKAGQENMELYRQWMQDQNLKGKFVYLPFYSAAWRTLTVRGCDIHVECPQPRCEACGTSWMLAQLNGILNLATLGGGHKGHSKLADPQTGEGDTLFIEP